MGKKIQFWFILDGNSFKDTGQLHNDLAKGFVDGMPHWVCQRSLEKKVFSEESIGFEPQP